jgi:hypothetical protein
VALVVRNEALLTSERLLHSKLDTKRKRSRAAQGPDDSSCEGKKTGDSTTEPPSGDAREYTLDLNRFPDKMRWLLDQNVSPEAYWWLPEGDAIAINKQVFSDQLLIKYFRGNKFPSITRNLNRW